MKRKGHCDFYKCCQINRFVILLGYKCDVFSLQFFIEPLHTIGRLLDSMKITIGSSMCRLGDDMGFWCAAIIDCLLPSPESTKKYCRHGKCISHIFWAHHTGNPGREILQLHGMCNIFCPMTFGLKTVPSVTLGSISDWKGLNIWV